MVSSSAYTLLQCVTAINLVLFLIFVTVAIAQSTDLAQSIEVGLNASSTNLTALVDDFANNVAEALSGLEATINTSLVDCDTFKQLTQAALACPSIVVTLSGISVASIVFGLLTALSVLTLLCVRPRQRKPEKFYPHRKGDPYSDL